MIEMISVEEALDKILAHVAVLPPQGVPLLGALGLAVAEDVYSEFDIPPLDNTSMDGYAVQAASTAGASTSNPAPLKVLGEVAAGYVFEGTVQPGTAIRIMTGAPIPAGADAVVPFEETDEPRHRPPAGAQAGEYVVNVLNEAKPGANIRRAGEDVRKGTLIIPAGKVLRPQELGVMGSLGRSHVQAIRRPIVAVLSTGDELAEVGEPLKPGQIYDSNAYSIAALVTRYGGVPKLLGIAKDTLEDLTRKIHAGLAEADMLVTSAGVSRGDYDIVKEALEREGQIAFWTVAMKPGKPLAFGYFDYDGRRIPHLGLPGNPVSSMVSFELFGRPAIFKMLGKHAWTRPTLKAIATEPIQNYNDPRRFYARCIVTRGEDGRHYASLTGPQGSGILTSMVYANALTVIPAEIDEVRPGEEIDVIMLDWSYGEEWGSA